MSRCFFLLCLFLSAMPASLTAQNGAPSAAGVGSIGMGGTGVAQTGFYSVFSNPAGLAFQDELGAGFWAEQRFLVAEIRSLSAAFGYPTASGTFGLSLNYFGFEGFNEQRLGIAYGRKLTDALSLGAQFFMLNTRIPEYGSKAVFTFEVGIQTKISRQLSAGVRVFSPARIEVLPDENLPTVFNLGFRYQPADQLTIMAEVEKDIEFPVRFRSGLEYTLVESVKVRLGVATEPVSLSFGLGYNLKNGLQIDVASTYHQVLGISPAVGVSYRGENKNGNDNENNRPNFF